MISPTGWGAAAMPRRAFRTAMELLQGWLSRTIRSVRERRRQP